MRKTMINTLDLAYSAGISDYYKRGLKYGHKAYPPGWMKEEEKRMFFKGKRYAISQEL